MKKQQQIIRREAYRIAVLMIEPAICGDATVVEENDLDPVLLKQELQRIIATLQKHVGGQEQGIDPT